jgi:hypothetical protein
MPGPFELHLIKSVYSLRSTIRLKPSSQKNQTGKSLLVASTSRHDHSFTDFFDRPLPFRYLAPSDQLPLAHCSSTFHTCSIPLNTA